MFKIAIQNKGKLSAPSVKYLKSLGFKFDLRGRKLDVSCSKTGFNILFLRSSDVPELVQSGIIEFGITGENVIYEKNFNVCILEKLGFATCSLMIAVPKNSDIKNIRDLNGERIATSYPNLLKKFLKKNGVSAAIIKVNGSVEVMPSLGLTDAVCDIVQTGNTLKQNNLKPLVTIMESQAILISNSNNKMKWKF